MPYTLERTLASADRLIDQFESRIGPVGREPRGVNVSEAFFIYATLDGYRPRQVLESGRARGQSTLLFARCFPESHIVSVEYHPDHPDAPIALDRLADRPHVSCLFGDATRLLPELALPGDVVVVDGPKGFRSLMIAVEILRRRRAEVIFIHDCPRGGTLRGVIERHLPWAFFSDDPRFVARYCRLDAYQPPEKLAMWSAPESHPPGRSYGGVFACIPAREGFPSRMDRAALKWARWTARMRRSVRKRIK